MTLGPMESRLTPYHSSPVPQVQAVLALAPHPDDEVFGCGAALALHVSQGAVVRVIVITSGDGGGDAQTRRAESLRAAAELGYEAPDFWGLPDRGVLYGEALVQRILQAIEGCGAEVLYAPSLWENHPDHRATALAAREAVRRHGACVLMAYEIGAPLRPNWLVDITTVLARKRAAMQCFASQLAVQAYDRQIEALNVFRTYSLQNERIEAIEAFERADPQALRRGDQAFLVSEYVRQREAGLMLLPEESDFVTVMIRSMDRPELDRALSSIAVQTWPRMEVVVVNAKGPGHRALPAWCGRFPLRLVESDAPLHRSVAANRALEAARGECLLFLDDDDWLDADHIAKLAKGLAARPDAAAAVTGVRGIDDLGQPVAQWQGWEGEVHRLLLANQMPIMSVLFRREGLDGVRFDEQLDVFEDWDFWMQLAERGIFVGVPGISANYLIRPFEGSGVHRQVVAEEGHARIRNKWRLRWPDAWFDRLRGELESMEGRSSGLALQLAQWQERGQTAEAALAQAHAAQQRAEQHNATMEHLRNIAEQQRVTAEQGRAASEQLRAAAEQARDEALQRCATAEHERNLARQQSAATQAADQQVLQAMLQSRSWKLSAPLRMLGSWIRRLRS